MRVLLIDSNKIDSSIYQLTKKLKNYLFNSLRLNEGDIFICKDEKETYYKATLFSSYIYVEKTELDESLLLDNLSGYKGTLPDISLYIGCLKGKKNESLVNALTQIGIKKIAFLITDYSERTSFTEHEKERIIIQAKEAVQQSGSKMPEIIFSLPFDTSINEAENILLLHQDKTNSSISLKEAIKTNQHYSSYSIFIGPEGGFSNIEIEKAKRNNAQLVLLKTNILRSEIAAIYTCSSLQTLIQ